MEYTIKLQPISEDSATKNGQIWFYRYDCIVSKAFPHISLQKSDNNQLIAR